VAGAPDDGDEVRRRWAWSGAATRSGRRDRRPGASASRWSPGEGPRAVGPPLVGGVAHSPPVSRSTRPADGTRPTTASRIFVSSGPMPSKLIPNRNPPAWRGPAPAHGAGNAHVDGLPAEARLHDEGRAGGGRLGLGVDAPPALADVGQEAGEPRSPQDIAAGGDERLDALGLAASPRPRPWRARSLRELRAFGCGDRAPLRSRRRC